MAERVERGVDERPVGERAQELAVEDRDLRLVAVAADDDDALLVRIVQDERVETSLPEPAVVGIAIDGAGAAVALSQPSYS